MRGERLMGGRGRERGEHEPALKAHERADAALGLRLVAERGRATRQRHRGREREQRTHELHRVRERGDAVQVPQQPCGPCELQGCRNERRQVRARAVEQVARPEVERRTAQEHEPGEQRQRQRGTPQRVRIECQCQRREHKQHPPGCAGPAAFPSPALCRRAVHLVAFVGTGVTAPPWSSMKGLHGGARSTTRSSPTP